MRYRESGCEGVRVRKLCHWVVICMVSSTSQVSAQTCDVEDINRNGLVDFDDFFWLVDQFGRQCARDEACDAADLDRDGMVESDDFFAFADVFGAACEGTAGACIASGDHLSIQRALDGDGARAILCEGAIFELGDVISFTADDQAIFTRGFPTDDTRALLKVVGANAATVEAGNNSRVRLRNVIIDGNRPALGTAPAALIEFGSTGSGNMVEWVKAFEPRGWSVLYLGEGDDRRCSNAIARLNDLGPAGKAYYIIADGISLGCSNSIVEYNTITDATDGGIVVFQAPGSLIANNTIRAQERIMFYGISMVDYGPWDGDFSGTRVTGNTIDAAGELIRRGISMGPYVGCIPAEETILRSRGAVVTDNVLAGSHMGWGFAVSGVEEWTVNGNVDASTHRQPPGELDCFGTPSNAPSGFQINPLTSSGSFQDEYETAVFGFTVGWWPADAVFEEECMAGLIGEDELAAIRSDERGSMWPALEETDNAHLFDRCATLHQPPETGDLPGELIVGVSACEPSCAQVRLTNISVDETADVRNTEFLIDGFRVDCAGLPEFIEPEEGAECVIADYVTTGFQVLRWYGFPTPALDSGWGFEYPFVE